MEQGGKREGKIQGQALAYHPRAVLGLSGQVLICSMFVCCFVGFGLFFFFSSSVSLTDLKTLGMKTQNSPT